MFRISATGGVFFEICLNPYNDNNLLNPFFTRHFSLKKIAIFRPTSCWPVTLKPRPGGSGKTGDTSASPFLSKIDYLSRFPSKIQLFSAFSLPTFRAVPPALTNLFSSKFNALFNGNNENSWKCLVQIKGDTKFWHYFLQRVKKGSSK